MACEELFPGMRKIRGEDDCRGHVCDASPLTNPIKMWSFSLSNNCSQMQPTRVFVLQTLLRDTERRQRVKHRTSCHRFEGKLTE